MTIQVVFAIAGVVSLLVGIIGGGIKAKEIEFPVLSLSARIITITIGAVLIGLTIFMEAKPQPSVTIVPTAALSVMPSNVPMTIASLPTPTELLPSINDWVGNWVNIDSDTRGWTRVEITTIANTIYIQFWGKCEPTDCDAGTGYASYQGNPVKVEIDSGFVYRTHTLELQGNTLRVVTFSHYTDDSGRRDNLSEHFFKK